MKPKVIAEYNKHKYSIDLSDQLASHCSPARRNIRCFQKLPVDLLFSIAVTNVYIIFKKHKNLSSKTYTITKFRENSLQMLEIKRSNSASSYRPAKHQFNKSLHSHHRRRLIRRRCIHCYERLRATGLSAVEPRNKTKKVNTTFEMSFSAKCMCRMLWRSA